MSVISVTLERCIRHGDSRPVELRWSRMDGVEHWGNPTGYVTLNRAAELLGLSEHQVRRLVRDGEIAVVRVGEVLWLACRELERWADAAAPDNWGSDVVG